MNKPDASRHAPDEIDHYLAALPDGVRLSLERLRGIIREVAPHCTERVSYGIPIFRLRKDLVGISAQKDHCSFHTMSPPLVATLAGSLQGVKLSGATIQFAVENPLPEELIRRIVRERMQEIAAIG